jgi:homoisocitrate dehydrogenase
MPSVCIIPGDGIGQEVIPAAERVLRAAVSGLEVVRADAGWDCFLRCGAAVPHETLEAVRSCGAALFGAVASPARKVEGYRSAILTLRQALDLYANLRPVRSLPGVSPRAGVDLLIVRENTEGLYAGRERLEDGGDTAVAERVITRRASRRLAERALALLGAGPRGAGAGQAPAPRRLTIVHKANILPLTDGLFRDTVRGVVASGTAAAGWRGPVIEVDEMLVDLAAYRLAAEPERFDGIITTNLFGDILSDLAAYWCGGMGLAPSINLGDGIALAEPVHGSAPDIAGTGAANPIAAILSAALLARYAWGQEESAGRIEQAVCQALAGGLPHGTEAITRAVLRYI